MVSKARDYFPDPERPVRTTSSFLGMSTDTFFRLCSLAPRILIYCFAIVISFLILEAAGFRDELPSGRDDFWTFFISDLQPCTGCRPYQYARRQEKLIFPPEQAYTSGHSIAHPHSFCKHLFGFSSPDFSGICRRLPLSLSTKKTPPRSAGTAAGRRHAFFFVYLFYCSFRISAILPRRLSASSRVSCSLAKWTRIRWFTGSLKKLDPGTAATP